MQIPANHRRPSQAAAATARRLTRAWAALHAATTSDAWVNATFRLMLATAPSAFASAALRCTEADAAYWTTSEGVRIHSAEMPEVIVGHPGVPYLMTHPGLKVLPTRGVLPPQAELEKTIFYQRFMVPYRWRHAVGLCFCKRNDEPGVECVMSVNRTAAEGDFSDAETERLGALHADIERALWRVAALEEERAARSSFEHFAENLPLPLALLSWELEPLYHNRLAREACALWLHGLAAARECKTIVAAASRCRRCCARCAVKCKPNGASAAARIAPAKTCSNASSCSDSRPALILPRVCGPPCVCCTSSAPRSAIRPSPCSSISSHGDAKSGSAPRRLSPCSSACRPPSAPPRSSPALSNRTRKSPPSWVAASARSKPSCTRLTKNSACTRARNSCRCCEEESL